ncbi:hypothetical protein RRG08_004503 [Elysia crispata]|uniref:Uncharacterized protein n=1 Tax=Elysia crispata TaxID=231223 RepID=A0AAE1EDR6_9GAST|nr:hypothetical protein RRG08_004503 [Elysia crispata]
MVRKNWSLSDGDLEAVSNLIRAVINVVVSAVVSVVVRFLGGTGSVETDTSRFLVSSCKPTDPRQKHRLPWCRYSLTSTLQ